MELSLPTLAATQRFAERVAAAVLAGPAAQPLTIALSGNLGTGKTQWARFFCNALGVPTEEITSPTYVLLQRYVGRRIVYHFDFYRLESVAEIWDLGIDELFEQPVVILIEWADKFPEVLPDDHLQIRFQQPAAEARTAAISASGSGAQALLTSLCLV